MSGLAVGCMSGGDIYIAWTLVELLFGKLFAEIGVTSVRYFNKIGWTAYFSGVEGGEMARMRDVESWDPVTGVALVVDSDSGVLKPVTAYEDFVRLERAGRIVGVVPGGGWRAVWEGEDGEGPLSRTVLGWLVTDIGGATPIVASPDGLVEIAESADRMISPDEEAGVSP